MNLIFHISGMVGMSLGVRSRVKMEPVGLFTCLLLDVDFTLDC